MNIRPLRSLFLIGFLSSSLAIVGCSSTESSSSGGPTSPTTSSAVDGSYSGRFDGDDSGPVKMTVSSSDVDVVATVSGKDYPGSGKVSSDGRIRIGLGITQSVTVTFDGTFANGKGSGTWSSSSGTKGSWSVSK